MKTTWKSPTLPYYDPIEQFSNLIQNKIADPNFTDS